MKFVTNKELTFFYRVNKELIQSVVEQFVVYYAILTDKTHVDNLYNESMKKVWATPVKINALVMYENTHDQITELPPDSKFNIDIYFHKRELQDRNTQPKMGDFVRFGKLMWEITSVSEPQPIAGIMDEQMMIKCPCVPARRGQINVPDFIDNTVMR